MAVAELELEGLLTAKPEGQFAIVWRRFRRHKLAVASMTVITLLFLLAILASVIAPYDPITDFGLSNRNAAPSAAHWMGTDQIGRDVLSRLLFAGRISLTIAFIVVLLTESVGALIGAVSGYYGGWVDMLIQRITDFSLILPTLPLLLVFAALLRDITFPGIPRAYSSMVVVIVVLTLFGWMGPCRQARAMGLSLRGREFTEASKALGASDRRIILRHMLPNSLPPLIVDATLALGGTIVLESALSFLGLGIQPPTASWGTMLSGALDNITRAPWLIVAPGLFITVTVLCIFLLADGVRDAMDPRLME